MASTTTSDLNSGDPFDNASVAARLAELPSVADAQALTVTMEHGDFAGFQATPAHPDPQLGDALLLHGWPEFAACWEQTAAILLEHGMSVFAYDQRGYSPGARPESVDEYTMPHLVADLDEISRAVGLDRFHLVGHDWGGMVAWHFAANHPERLRTSTVVSTPHPIAHVKQVQADPDQYERMGYLRAIQDHPEGVARTLLRGDGQRLIDLYAGDVPDDMAASYVSRLSEPGAMDAVLKYYQAADGRARLSSTPVTVPTSFVWGSRDIAFPRGTAELTAKYVEGPYRFVPLEGASHWLPESHPGEIAREVLALAREHAGA
ncbi:alpha/beta fold hydrolase [Brevibacterium antiquum]|uniref:Pimeloyl-ACP methyl ester carboxylesterase n=1 Tax=Brevibacterium antiquum TaxID=234835 RepID=A0A2H1K2I8_9MICO|nr:alpha/beta hydrolase [Brevibacterium antiquum]SMX93512.1 Pimeloyl-ACP methyl ester carboxylesterase [Brevibacterium antiquum]